MNVTLVEIEKLPYPYREILGREVEKLKKNDDVLAIGLAGSVARNDIWQASDLDIEVIVKGEKTKRLVCTEQEISVDYAYFGEHQISDLPHDTRPIYDPAHILTRTLRARTKKQLWQKMIQKNTDSIEKCLQKAKSALRSDPCSALCHIQNGAAELGSNLVLAADMAPSVRRTISKLETAMNRIGRLDLFNKYVSLYGIPATLEKADFLSQQLEQGYAEVWSYMHEKAVGPAYMDQQSSSDPWFRNRIKPILEHDKRDLVWIVFIEYPFILNYVLKTLGISDFPANVFEAMRNVTGPPALWVNRHRRILSLIPQKNVPYLLTRAEELGAEVKRLASMKRLG
jgi:hypothetical protein